VPRKIWWSDVDLSVPSCHRPELSWTSADDSSSVSIILHGDRPTPARYSQRYKPHSIQESQIHSQEVEHLNMCSTPMDPDADDVYVIRS
jgi:hypothetical protein